MKVDVDLSLCQGYGVCAQIAPEVFDLDDDGFVVLIGDGQVPQDLGAVTREAAAACPAFAIAVSD